MSVRVLNLVFEHSRATANDRCVLLVLADHAHDDGTSAYPSHKTIAAKAGGIGERTVRDCLKRLEQLGEIEREGWSPKHTISYRITISDNPAASAGSNPAASDPDPADGRSNPADPRRPTRQTAADKPSLEPPRRTVLEPSVARARDNALRVLGEIAEIRGAPTPAMDRVERAIAEYPQADPLAAARDLRDWLCDGTGQSRKVRDVVGYFRHKLERMQRESRPGGRTNGRRQRVENRIEELHARANGAAVVEGDAAEIAA
jgi:helix-turn-helix protein